MGLRDITLDLEDARAVYVLNEWRVFSSYIIGAPDFVNEAFVARWVIADPSSAPAVPTGVSATKIDIPFAPDDVWVHWTHTPGATWYEIQHSDGGAFASEVWVTEPGYRDRAPVFLGPDSYRVRACNDTGCSAFSAIVTEGEQGFMASLIDALSALGIAPADLCASLVSRGVSWLVASAAPYLLPLVGLITPLLPGALGCP